MKEVFLCAFLKGKNGGNQNSWVNLLPRERQGISCKTQDVKRKTPPLVSTTLLPGFRKIKFLYQDHREVGVKSAPANVGPDW